MTATRLYFAGAGTSAITPSFNGLWGSTGSAVARPLWTSAQLSAGVTNNTSTQINETSSTSPFDRCCRQHASDSQVATAHTISGTFSMVIPAQESSTNLNGFLQVTISVWDSTGTTKRGDLYAGTTNTAESATVGAINEEFTTGTMATRIIPSGTALTSVAASVGDRIVVEIGFRACNTSATSMGALFRINDTPGAAGGDYALTSGNTATNARPWIEFTDDIFGASGTSYTGGAAKTVTVGTSSAARLGLTGGAARALSVAASSAGVRGKLGATTRTITVAASSAARLGLVAGTTKTITVTTAAAGQRGKLGATTRIVTIAASSAARLGVSGTVTSSITVAASSAGLRGKTGAVTRGLAIATTSTGTVATPGGGGATKVITISSVSAARLGRKSAANPVALTLTSTAGGTRGKVSAATTALTLTVTAGGIAQSPPRDVKVLAVADVSRAVEVTDLSRVVDMEETPRELTITEEVYE